MSGALFIFHRELNMKYYGFNSIFCLNVFLIGVFLCLMIKWDGNFWIACGFHTAWNYMQFHILGLSNSGSTPEVAFPAEQMLQWNTEKPLKAWSKITWP